jgi:hypothetical protein
MWINLKDKNQVTIIGEKSKGYGMGKRKRTMDKKKLLSELARSTIYVIGRNLESETAENDQVA